MNLDHVQVLHHGIFGYRDHQHLVIGEVTAIHGLAEADLVELRPVCVGVIHRVDIEVFGVPIHFGFQLARVQPRSCGHVQAVVGQNLVLVVDQRERAPFLLFLDAGRAVGFVAKHQIKRRRTFGLSVSDELQRLIGTKHDGHRLGVNFFEFACDLFGISGHRHSQLSHVGILVVATRTSVRTNADIAMRDIQVALTRPLPHRLAHQGN